MTGRIEIALNKTLCGPAMLSVIVAIAMFAALASERVLAGDQPVAVVAAAQASSLTSNDATGSLPFAAIGRPALDEEIAAWDIDVRSDFKGLPPGSGSVDDGMVVWEAKCANCHGVFGESNEVFTPIVGGTDEADIESGRVAHLISGNYPQRTTLMKLSQISSLWDYIHRAMPWNEPKSLSVDEVYAVTAFILSLADIVEPDFVLSQDNMADVQQRLPNRNGMERFEPMWIIGGTPDVQGDDCMQDCPQQSGLTSILPDHARDAHGNLAEQNRLIGPVRGADTLGSAPLTLAETRQRAAEWQQLQFSQGSPASVTVPDPAHADPTIALAQASACMACHGVERGLVGPSFKAVADKYRDRADASEYLVGKVLHGAKGNWGQIPMPANTHVQEDDAQRLVKWILQMGT